MREETHFVKEKQAISKGYQDTGSEMRHFSHAIVKLTAKRDAANAAINIINLNRDQPLALEPVEHVVEGAV